MVVVSCTQDNLEGSLARKLARVVDTVKGTHCRRLKRTKSMNV